MTLPSVFITVPTRGAIHNQTISRLEAIRDRNPEIGPFGYSAGHLSSHETREQIARYFLTTDKEVLIMCDDDVVPPMHMLRLRQWFVEHDIVGAAVPMFQPDVAPIPLLMAWNYFPEIEAWKTLDDVWGRESVVGCDAVGFGCVAIHRRVFEKMEPPYYPMEYNASGTITDDLAFCRRAKELGFRVACDFEVKCEHFSVIPLMRLSEGMSDLINATFEAREVQPIG